MHSIFISLSLSLFPSKLLCVFMYIYSNLLAPISSSHQRQSFNKVLFDRFHLFNIISVSKMAKEYFNLDYHHLVKEINTADRDLENLDDAEDALSLCDLAMDGSCEDDSKEEERSSFDQDFFEFSSEDFSSSTISSDNIIFCGKLITNKEPLVPEKKTHKPKPTNNPPNTKKSPFLPWKSHSFNKSRPTSLSSKPSHQEKRYNKTWSLPASKYGYNNNGKSGNEKFDFYSVKKVSIMATPVKSSRWYLLAFGVGRSPVEMELRGIKTRNPTTSMSRSDDKKKNMVNKSGCRLWGLLRVLRFKRKGSRQ